MMPPPALLSPEGILIDTAWTECCCGETVPVICNDLFQCPGLGAGTRYRVTLASYLHDTNNPSCRSSVMYTGLVYEIDFFGNSSQNNIQLISFGSCERCFFDGLDCVCVTDCVPNFGSAFSCQNTDGVDHFHLGSEMVDFTIPGWHFDQFVGPCPESGSWIASPSTDDPSHTHEYSGLTVTRI